MTALLLTWLFNALWQLPLLLLATTLAARLLRSFGPTAAYRLWFTSLCLGAVLPALPGFLSRRWWISPAGHAASGRVSVHPAGVVVPNGLTLPVQLCTALLVLYGLAMTWSIARCIFALWSTWRMRASALTLQLDPADCLPVFSAAGMPSFTLAESASVPSPMTVGIRHPAILIPAGLWGQLSPAQRGALLAHEITHIRRHDFATNFALRVLTLPLSWHPCIPFWFARLSVAREIVCDQVAADSLDRDSNPGAKTRYARLLLQLAGILAQSSRVSTAFEIGIFTRYTLERRIMSLTSRTSQMSPTRRIALFTGTCLLAAGTCTTALAWHTPLSPAKQVKVQGGVIAGNLRTKVAPVYPQAAKDAKVQGTVVLKAIIGKDGKIDNLTVLSGPPELASSALDAVHQWTYEPYLLNGEPTEVETTININYSLGN